MDLTWGKPKIKIGKLGANGAAPSTWIEIPTPVETSTKLATTKGTKKEAKIEGGENEAIKYSANNYTFEFEIRMGEGRTAPIEDVDGVIAGEYAVKVQPENSTLKGIIIDRSAVSVEETWDSENGSKLKYTFDVLKPATGNMVKREVVNFSSAGSLKVVISNDGGAGMWKLSTETDWHASGTTISAAPGKVTIEYKSVSGKTSPSLSTATSATLLAGKLVTVNASYTAAG